MEKEEIIGRYKKRDHRNKGVLYDLKPENQYIYQNYDLELVNLFQHDYDNGTLSKKNILVIGSGFGREIFLMNRIGIHPNQITCFEIIKDRYEYLKSIVNGFQNYVNDYFQATIAEDKYDYIICSTVFSSILDEKNRISLLKDIELVLNPTGKLIIFDFIFNNPKNKDVRKFVISDYTSHTKLKVIRNKRIVLYPAITKRLFKTFPLIVFLLTKIRLLNTHSISILIN